MTEEIKDQENTTEKNLLLVSGSKGSKGNDKEYVKKLSNAINQVFYKHKSARMRCVGAASLNNAVKAFIIAKGEAQKRGETFLLDISFTTVSFDGDEKTGIILDVVSSN